MPRLASGATTRGRSSPPGLRRRCVCAHSWGGCCSGVPRRLLLPPCCCCCCCSTATALLSLPQWKNLIRVHRAGIPSPAPLLLRGHVVAMSFLGEDGWPWPQLRDAPLRSAKAWRNAYAQVRCTHHGRGGVALHVVQVPCIDDGRGGVAPSAGAPQPLLSRARLAHRPPPSAAPSPQVVTIMHALYHWCHLVHADLSEYNLLVGEEEGV